VVDSWTENPFPSSAHKQNGDDVEFESLLEKSVDSFRELSYMEKLVVAAANHANVSNPRIQNCGDDHDDGDDVGDDDDHDNASDEHYEGSEHVDGEESDGCESYDELDQDSGPLTSTVFDDGGTLKTITLNGLARNEREVESEATQAREWSEYWDERRRRPYYVHAPTGLSQWQPPTAWHALALSVQSH
jgi:hypothetical protein